MAVPYNHKVIEKKWRKQWEEHPINVNDGKKDKYYCLDMFPYPSGNGLHVGHWRGYVISDVWSRYKLMHGYYVMGCIWASSRELRKQNRFSSGRINRKEYCKHQTSDQ